MARALGKRNSRRKRSLRIVGQMVGHGRGSRRAYLVVLVIVVVLGGAGCGGGSAPKGHAATGATLASGARTRIVYVRPTTMNGSLRSGYTVSERVDGGLCLEPSEFV